MCVGGWFSCLSALTPTPGAPCRLVGPTALCMFGLLARRCHYVSRVDSRVPLGPCHCLSLRRLDVRRRHTAAVAVSTCNSYMYHEPSKPSRTAPRGATLLRFPILLILHAVQVVES